MPIARIILYPSTSTGGNEAIILSSICLDALIEILDWFFGTMLDFGFLDVVTSMGCNFNDFLPFLKLTDEGVTKEESSYFDGFLLFLGTEGVL
jgi:hypothetical protein